MTNLPQTKIIVALDVPTFAAAKAWIDRLSDVIFWKVGLELFIADGQRVLNYLKEKQKRIFLDLKLHDIPNTVARACQVASSYEVDFLTVHTAGGKEMLRCAQEAISNSSTKLLAVTVLTSLTDRDLLDLKVSMSLPEYVIHLAKISQELGLAGVVCSPQELQSLRSMLTSHFLLVTPGIRFPGDAHQDQQRFSTPSQAFRNGADYIVVGRSVLQGANPEAIWANLCAEVR
ncbi:MAG: orotidine-5'-phosphate decarboxylase [Cyanobacteria bacterium M5B4]|nr:MAG: orotidine-5'-phosphate decarboxylase [Cyanobacteria bacterium M5B4]